MPDTGTLRSDVLAQFQHILLTGWHCGRPAGGPPPDGTLRRDPGDRDGGEDGDI
jgi:hypothetical protein